MSAPEEKHAEVQRYLEPGIEEHHGIVPAWLKLVYLVMAIWMVWYLLKFWTNHG